MTTREITNDELLTVFASIRLMADSYFRTRHGACDFREMSENEQFEYFNDVVLPLWEAAGCPQKGYGRYLEFQDSVRATW